MGGDMEKVQHAEVMARDTDKTAIMAQNIPSQGAQILEESKLAIFSNPQVLALMIKSKEHVFQLDRVWRPKSR